MFLANRCCPIELLIPTWLSGKSRTQEELIEDDNTPILTDPLCDESCALVCTDAGANSSKKNTNLTYSSTTKTTVASTKSVGWKVRKKNANLRNSSLQVEDMSLGDTNSRRHTWFNVSSATNHETPGRQARGKSVESLTSKVNSDGPSSGGQYATEELKLAVMGAPMVGKTAMVNQFLCKVFIRDYTPTVEDFNWVEYDKNGGSLMVKIIDSSGSRDFLAMRNLYIRTAEAFLLVFAVNDADSFAEVVQLYQEIKQNNPRAPAIQVVGNKTDLFAGDDKWTVTRGMISNFISTNRASLAEITAKNTDEVEQVFRQVLQLSAAGSNMNQGDVLKKRRQSMPAVMTHRGGLPNLTKAEMEKLAALDPTARKTKARTGSCKLS